MAERNTLVIRVRAALAWRTRAARELRAAAPSGEGGVGEQDPAADNGGAERVEGLVGKHQMTERATQRFRRATDAGNGLAIGLLDIVLERDWRGADVGTLLHGLVGPAATEIGQVVTVADFTHQVAAGNLDALFVFQELHAIADDLERQTKVLGEIAANHAATNVQRAQDHVVDEAWGQARFLDRVGS